LIGDYSFFDTKPIRFKRFLKQRELSKGLNKFKNVQRLIAISQGWYILEKKKDKWYFYDLRFGLIPRKDSTSFFTFSYLLKKQNEKIYASELPKTDRDARFMMTVLWNRIQGNWC
tara:strand:+ start:124 stop:468 length:345 start_codon:yes stop_codon:yes gene_type:complete